MPECCNPNAFLSTLGVIVSTRMLKCSLYIRVVMMPLLCCSSVHECIIGQLGFHCKYNCALNRKNINWHMVMRFVFLNLLSLFDHLNFLCRCSHFSSFTHCCLVMYPRMRVCNSSVCNTHSWIHHLSFVWVLMLL